MSTSYVIEVDDEQVGLVTKERDQVRFFSAVSSLSSIDGHLFRSALAATQAARRILSRKTRIRRPAAAPSG